VEKTGLSYAMDDDDAPLLLAWPELVVVVRRDKFVGRRRSLIRHSWKIFAYTEKNDGDLPQEKKLCTYSAEFSF